MRASYFSQPFLLLFAQSEPCPCMPPGPGFPPGPQWGRGLGKGRVIEILPPLQNQEERETAQGSGESRMRHFNSLSAFPGEDNIIYSGFGGLYPVEFLKVFLNTYCVSTSSCSLHLCPLSSTFPFILQQGERSTLMALPPSQLTLAKISTTGYIKPKQSCNDKVK